MATRVGTAVTQKHHGESNGKAEVVPVKTTTSARREKEKAVQDPGLSDYRLGECIGKGAFASVYKAFNWGTGDTVAVKQIRLVDLSKSELHNIETEIDLLKGLNHEHIVQYIGFVKTTDCLNIILEYCENGSLHSICKAYGKFPENLVGLYMTQVLDGVRYLHHQGVIHRDIKGANILTTKNGLVKLADFGVSISTIGNPVKEAQVVGTPYWMAPEIIQLSAPTSASDIWSVGCTVIELLEGKPPYHNLAPMPALFAIVNDDHPPLPDGVSPAARDFMMQCFQKDPNLRVTANKLIKHTWIVGCSRKEVFASRETAVKGIKEYNQRLESSKNTFRASAGGASQQPPNGTGSGRSSRLQSAAGQQSTLRLGVAIKSQPLKMPASQSQGSFVEPEAGDQDNWDDDFASAISPTALRLSHLRTQDSSNGDVDGQHRRQTGGKDAGTRNGRRSDDWDDSFVDSPQSGQDSSYFLGADQDDETIRLTPKVSTKQLASPARRAPSKSPTKQALNNSRNSKVTLHSAQQQLGNKFELPSRSMSAYREQSFEDYSDLLAADDDSIFDKAIPSRPLAQARSVEPVKTYSKFDQSPPAFINIMPPPTSGVTMQQRPRLSSRATAPVEGYPPPVRRIKSHIEIQKYAESEVDADFSDIFGPNSKAVEARLRGQASQQGAELMLMSKLSNGSWVGDDDDEEDPFALMDPEFNEMDLEANIARDRHARLAQRVEELVKLLKIGDETAGEDTVADVAEDLLQLLWDNKDVKDLIISAHGLLPILELLTWPPDTFSISKSRQDMILPLLKVVNRIILDDKELQENLCFVGGIPIITRFAARQFSNEMRLEAAAFVQQMYQTSTLTLQMFVSCGGISVLASFLDEDYELSRDLVIMGVNGIWSVFGLQGPTPKNDFCRLFSKAKVLDPLAEILHKVLDADDRDDLSEFVEGRIVDLFYLFSQADADVKELIADRNVLKTVLKDLKRMTAAHQITMLKFIKNISSLPTTVEVLHSADAIDFLIELLSHSMKKTHPHIREISNQVLNTMFNLCRLSKERQEYAAVHGIIPLLMKIMRGDRPPKEFALPILCDMAHSGSRGRRYLWQNKGLDFYVSLLTDQYWQTTALDAIFVWLQEETAKVETHLLSGGFEAAIVSCFTNPKINAFAYDPTLLEPLDKVLRMSPALAASLAKPEMYAGIESKLNHKKPGVRLGLLRLVRDIMESCEPDTGIHDAAAGGGALMRMFNSIQMLERDSAVLVGNLAHELVKSHAESADSCDTLSIISGVSSGGGSGRSRGPRRRKSLYMTPPNLQSSTSAPQPPPTPSIVHSTIDRPRLRHSESTSSSATVYQQVAHTPRRTQHLTTAYGQESSVLRRPRSKDGAAVTLIPRRVSSDNSSLNGLSSLSSSTTSSKLPRTYSSTSTHSRPGTATSTSSTTSTTSITPTKPVEAGLAKSGGRVSLINGGHLRADGGSSGSSNVSGGFGSSVAGKPTRSGGGGGGGGGIPPSNYHMPSRSSDRSSTATTTTSHTTASTTSRDRASRSTRLSTTTSSSSSSSLALSSRFLTSKSDEPKGTPASPRASRISAMSTSLREGERAARGEIEKRRASRAPAAREAREARDVRKM